MMQKRLISRTEEIVEVERVLQEKDRLYVELRAVLERQPGPEIIEQLAVYQRVSASYILHMPSGISLPPFLLCFLVSSRVHLRVVCTAHACHFVGR